MGEWFSAVFCTFAAFVCAFLASVICAYVFMRMTDELPTLFNISYFLGAIGGSVFIGIIVDLYSNR